MRTSGILILMLPMMAAAQAYRPMPEGNAGWVEGHVWEQPYLFPIDCMGQTQFNCTRTIRFGTDTVIDGTSYHTLYRYGSCSYQMVGVTFPIPGCPWSGVYTEPTALLGFMRQDTDDRKVFWRDGSTGGEALLYDFNMGVGTYPSTYNNPGWNSNTVIAIDSILLGDGYHKRWILDTPNANDSTFVIEGVGSSFGLMNEMYAGIESGTMLGCFARHDSIVYQHPFLVGSACDMHVGVSSLVPETTRVPIIMPNPGTDHFTIILPPGAPLIRLFDATGREVMSQRASGPSVQVSAIELPSGIYTVRVDDMRPVRWLKQ